MGASGQSAESVVGHAFVIRQQVRQVIVLTPVEQQRTGHLLFLPTRLFRLLTNIGQTVVNLLIQVLLLLRQNAKGRLIALLVQQFLELHKRGVIQETGLPLSHTGVLVILVQLLILDVLIEMLSTNTRLFHLLLELVLLLLDLEQLPDLPLSHLTLAAGVVVDDLVIQIVYLPHV